MTYQELLAAYSGLPYWWKWKNFQPKEVGCKHCGELWSGSQTYPPEYFLEAMDALQRLRDAWGKPIVINSGHRCKAHNDATPGAVPNSQHCLYIAFDCKCPKADQARFWATAEKVGFKWHKYYDTFVHLDMRNGR